MELIAAIDKGVPSRLTTEYKTKTLPMTHSGILCSAAIGHLNPITTLGWELQQRGHQVTLFGLLDAQSNAHSAGLAFKAIAQSQFPLGAMSRIFEKQGSLSGLESLRYTMDWVTDISSAFLQEAPAAIKAAGMEALLVDQVSPEGGTIAEHLNLPFVSVASVILVYQDSLFLFRTTRSAIEARRARICL